MPRYIATNSFSGPVAVASKGSVIELSDEQAAQLGDLVELTPQAAAEQAAAEQAAAEQAAAEQAASKSSKKGGSKKGGK